MGPTRTQYGLRKSFSDERFDMTADQQADSADGGQVSQGPSGFAGVETSGGGADAVPDSPDTVPADNIPEHATDD